MPPQTLGDAPAKARAVDRHDHIRTHRAHRGDRLAHPAQDQRRPRQDFGNADHREVGERHQTVETLRPHALAADARNPKTAPGALPQPPDQRGAERIARRFAGDDKDERRRG